MSSTGLKMKEQVSKHEPIAHQKSSPLQDRPEDVLQNGQDWEDEPIDQPMCIILAGLGLYGSDATVCRKDEAEK